MTEERILRAGQDGKTGQTNSPPADAQKSDLPPGWHVAQPEKLPRPTYWPAVMALGITFVFWGIVTTLAISAVGFSLTALALSGWIGELRNEQ
jgi:hypothetical protein